MKYFRIGKILLAFALLSGVFLYAAKTHNYDRVKKSGVIVGQISICSGLNEGMGIKILGTSFDATTDSIGNFRISYVQPGTYSLTVMQNRHKLGTITDVVVTSKQTVNIGTTQLCLDNDADGYNQEVDCNDNNPAINPSAVEVCGDGIDNNCNGETDEGCTVCTDNDLDGFFAQSNCGTGIDCNDADALINPSALELCNGKDDDCDGEVDEEAIDQQIFYLDADEDGYGNSTNTLTACIQPVGYVSVGGDIDDSNPALGLCMSIVINHIEPGEIFTGFMGTGFMGTVTIKGSHFTEYSRIYFESSLNQAVSDVLIVDDSTITFFLDANKLDDGDYTFDISYHDRCNNSTLGIITILPFLSF